MITEYRKEFNARFTDEKYARFLAELNARAGAEVKFRINETPCFFPAELIQRMVDAGKDMLAQLVSNAEYLAAADLSIPVEYRVPAPSGKPLFVQADFGIIAGVNGEWEPRLVEIQGFPSLYGFQSTLAETYRDVYELDPSLETLLGGVSEGSYKARLRRAVLAGHDPENVVLLEVDPWSQKTLPDFLVTEKICGIRTVDICDVRRSGTSLYYERAGVRVPIKRIYNRAIADELIRKNVRLAFEFRDELDVEWAGNPNWFFRISKFSLPWLKHPTVPRTWFLDQVGEDLPMDPAQLVLKPLFSFAGLGVTIAPTREEIAAIPQERRSEYILQERMDFAATIATPPGDAKAEVRIMYLWDEELVAVNTIVRTGRGRMMGVDQNRDLTWVGASAGFFPGRAA